MSTVHLKQQLLKISAVVLLAGLFNPVFADMAGNAIKVTGNVTIADTNGSRSLSSGDVLNEGDQISTAARSGAKLQMKDGAIIALASESTLKIVRYNFEEASGEKNSAQLILVQGRFRTITGSIDKKAYRLETPSAIVRIQGTVFDVLSNPDGKQSSVILREGGLTVESLCKGSGSGDILMLNVPGLATAVETCMPPTKPIPAEDTPELDKILPKPGQDCDGSPCPPPEVPDDPKEVKSP